jgi:hypothetical protein
MARKKKGSRSAAGGNHVKSDDEDYRRGASINAINTWDDIGGDDEDECEYLRWLNLHSRETQLNPAYLRLFGLTDC